MGVETNVYQNNQTTIPTVYIKKYNVEPEDIVEWEENEDGKLYVTFRKKVTISEMIGAGKKSKNTNAAKLEEELYNND